MIKDTIQRVIKKIKERNINKYSTHNLYLGTTYRRVDEDDLTYYYLHSECFQVEDINEKYEAWAFGDAADELAVLVLNGIKTATASAYPLYALEGEDIPKAGQYSVILNSREEAVCIIRTEKVYVVPFHQVDERQAYLEGEGDRSLFYWREVHERFFRSCMAEAGLPFDENMEVVCEEFVRVFP